ncbi:uracil-DNA glycosylase family protein [Methanococcoides seepicolus]|uniref:HTH HARE-type domain-containing protein n=1 Tax=Methanococcoides seepicolus TaxID=2828780 RepID=A0A9E5DB94_9EURY|nr:uracil-DNA glycosylase family protein [Methanococcoides seepicolus]MCM1986861.1 hypothetical protein [Methanococcoides seepicolus]
MKDITWHTEPNNKDEAMREIIKEVRNCNLNCYREEYKKPLKTLFNRIISVEELMNGRPLIDDWRSQDILFISQAPSKQAWVDNELSSLDNSFFTDFLLKKIYPNNNSSVAIEKWKQNVFWIHTANCYPGKGEGGDKVPNMDCAEMYFDKIIETMNPKLIILMGLSATKFFTEYRRLSDINKKSPRLKDILYLQYDKQKPFFVDSKDGTNQYETIVIPHAANLTKLSESGIFAYNLLIDSLIDGKAKKNEYEFTLKTKDIVSSSKHTWLDEIVYVLKELGGHAKNKDIFIEVEKRGMMNFTPRWKNSVIKTIGLHSSDSKSYKEGNSDRFYKIDRGHWGLRDFK